MNRNKPKDNSLENFPKKLQIFFFISNFKSTGYYVFLIEAASHTNRFKSSLKLRI